MVLFLDRVLNIDETVKASFIEIAQNKKRKRGKKKEGRNIRCHRKYTDA